MIITKIPEKKMHATKFSNQSRLNNNKNNSQLTGNRKMRERVEREVGVGIGMGKTCKLKAVSFQCMTKFNTNLKK